MEFDWDPVKDQINRTKHGIAFAMAQQAFTDPKRVIAIDRKHARSGEVRYFCFGKVAGIVATVRFVVRTNKIRIFGAGYWREGKSRYEKENKIRNGP